MFKIKTLPILRRAPDGLFYEGYVFRMNRWKIRSTDGFIARSNWKIRKVSSDQMISPVDGFQPQLPV